MKYLEDFDDLIIKLKEETGCQEIVEQNNIHIEQDNGYAVTNLKNKTIRIHRIAYMFYYGDIPDNKIVCHKCDNRLCVRPDHLFLGSKKDNTKDMVSKGRFSDWSDRPVNSNGKKSKMKLTREQVSEIRSSDLSSYKLAKLYNVSSVQIRRIKNGARCSNIT